MLSNIFEFIQMKKLIITILLVTIDVIKYFSFTLWAGRFTPAANVDVQHIHLRMPPRKASSNNFLSALVNP